MLCFIKANLPIAYAPFPNKPLVSVCVSVCVSGLTLPQGAVCDGAGGLAGSAGRVGFDVEHIAGGRIQISHHLLERCLGDRLLVLHFHWVWGGGPGWGGLLQKTGG